jgi:hypothetical protein
MQTNMIVRLVVLLSVVGIAYAGELRTWTFEKNGNAIVAELVGFTTVHTNELAAILKMYDGSTYTVPSSYLVETNRSYLALEWAKKVEADKALEAAMEAASKESGHAGTICG